MNNRLTFCLFTLLLCNPLSIAHAQSETIILQANESSPYWSASLPLDGMAGEIVHAISKEAGIKSSIEYRPLNRLIADDSNNDLGNPAFYITNQDFDYILPIAVYYVSIFYYNKHIKEPLKVNSIHDLKGLTMGALKGTVINTALFESAGVKVEESYTQASLFKKLKRGRIDICVEIDLVGQEVIRQNFPSELENFSELKLQNSASPIAIMIAKNRNYPTDIGERFHNGLEKVMESGKYKEIVEKYYGKDQIPENWNKKLLSFHEMYLHSHKGEQKE